LSPADFALVIRAGIFGKGYPITEIVYGASNEALYVGVAPRNSLTSQPNWIVEKLTYDVNLNMTQSRISPDNSIFDNYATLDYR
jgi:hypothetical protein